MAVQQYRADPVFAAQATLGEGPLWDPRCQMYWWIDINEKKLFRFDPELRRNTEWQLDQIPGSVVLRRSGGLMLALKNGFASFDPDSGRIEMLGDPEHDQPDNRFNDGRCDPAGRFWAGTMRIERHMEIFTGSLYSLEPDRSIVRRFGEDIGVSNGIVWSGDATRMYLVDSPRRSIFRFDYDRATGDIGNRTCIFRAPDKAGFPDGMTIDSEDKLWVAFWGGGCVARICPESSQVLARVQLPVSIPTACTFGGPDLDQLLITTASVGLNAAERLQQNLAGDLFIAKVRPWGLPQPEYIG